MARQNRRACVTVIGRFWVAVGGLMCLSAITALCVPLMTGQLLEVYREASGIFKFFPILLPIQFAMGILGIISGVSFLKLKSWSRPILELLTWVSLILVTVGGTYWIRTIGLVGIIFIGIYGLALGIIIRYLRGNTVKNAMINHTEPTDG